MKSSTYPISDAISNPVWEGNSQVRDFVALLKPRVMSLVVFTGMVGLYLAPGTLHPFLAFIAIACISLGSGAAGAINMWIDRDIDAVMERTQKRPIPMGKIAPEEALHFGVFCAVTSVFIMSVAINYMAALLLASAILFYVFIYSMWLKRSTPQNIVIGGAAGAFPPLIGWAAVTGDVTIEPLLLFTIIFMWTPPHFWALALYRSGDYAKAGIPMLPVVSGSKHTRLQMLLYTLALGIVTLVPVFIGMTGVVYATGAIVLGLRFYHYAARIYVYYTERCAKQMFRFSILYLFLLFILLVVDKLLFVPIA